MPIVSLDPLCYLASGELVVPSHISPSGCCIHTTCPSLFLGFANQGSGLCGGKGREPAAYKILSYVLPASTRFSSDEAHSLIGVISKLADCGIVQIKQRKHDILSEQGKALLLPITDG